MQLALLRVYDGVEQVGLDELAAIFGPELKKLRHLGWPSGGFYVVNIARLLGRHLTRVAIHGTRPRLGGRASQLGARKDILLGHFQSPRYLTRGRC